MTAAIITFTILILSCVVVCTMDDNENLFPWDDE